MIDKELLERLVCPQCKGELTFEKSPEELHCSKCSLAYPVRDDIPVMLVDEARTLKAE